MKLDPSLIQLDECDLHLLTRCTWCLGPRGIYGWTGGEQMLTRQILSPPKGLVVDHIDHNIFNNRRSNLRIVTYKANSLHRKRLSIRRTKNQLTKELLKTHHLNLHLSDEKYYTTNQ